MTTVNVLTVIGWSFLILSWVIPYIIRKRNGELSAKGDSYFIGAVLAAVSCGIFLSTLVINIMK